jgi:HPr kinase/phosphorylase
MAVTTDNHSSSPVLSVHGVLVSVHGFGVLIVGRSGIGKSACALELIANGHQLIADDVVEIALVGETAVGSPPAPLYGLLEIRGLGICDVRALFCDTSLTGAHQIDLCIDFKEAAPEPVNRLGQVSETFELFGAIVPKIIFVTDGSRNARVFVETAARYFALDGRAASRELLDRIDRGSHLNAKKKEA